MCARARRLVALHSADSALTAAANTTLPALQAFCDAYDAATRGDIPWTRDSQSGRAAAYELVLVARMWMPLSVRDLPGAERANFLDSRISDDLTEDVEQLITTLRDCRQTDGTFVGYRESAVDALDVALRTANLKWEAAEANHVEYGHQMATLRRMFDEARGRYRSFLQTCAFTFTFLSQEYLTLLPSRAGLLLENDEVAGPRPEIIEPATWVTGIPQSFELSS